MTFICIYTLKFRVWRVQIGGNGCAYGFEWVRRGAGARGDTKTRQAETKIVVQDMFLILWPGKYPRTSCFFRSDVESHKCTQMGSYELRMGVMGCMDKGGTQNKVKRDTNAWTGYILECMVTAKKHSKLAGMVAVTKKTNGTQQTHRTWTNIRINDAHNLNKSKNESAAAQNPPNR